LKRRYGPPSSRRTVGPFFLVRLTGACCSSASLLAAPDAAGLGLDISVVLRRRGATRFRRRVESRAAICLRNSGPRSQKVSRLYSNLASHCECRYRARQSTRIEAQCRDLSAFNYKIGGLNLSLCPLERQQSPPNDLGKGDGPASGRRHQCTPWSKPYHRDRQ
jgi:hypothetical protein